jgi:DNA-directed RNA polymerase specialized sigma24 family protein
MTEVSRIDPLLCEALIARVTLGDKKAWQSLVAHLWSALFKIVAANPSMGPLARNDDEVRNVLTKLVERLGRDDARALQLYGAWRQEHADKTFADWIRIVTSNIVRDHVREVLADAAAFDDPTVTRLLNEFATSPVLSTLASRPPITNAQTARELFEFAARMLPPDQHRALVLWVEGASFSEIGTELGLATDQAATNLVRAAVAVLRRAFGGSG